MDSPGRPGSPPLPPRGRIVGRSLRTDVDFRQARSSSWGEAMEAGSDKETHNARDGDREGQ